jgi:tetratricopeptide (TPR) repeat protein
MATQDDAQRLKELGQDQFRVGELDEALETFEQARQLFAKAGDRNAEGEMVNNLGVVHMKLDALQQADDCFREARSIFEQSGYQAGLGIVLCHQGMLRASQDQDEEAISLLQESMRILDEAGERERVKDVRRELRKVTGEGFPASLTRGLLSLLDRVTGSATDDEADREAAEESQEPDVGQVGEAIAEEEPPSNA